MASRKAGGAVRIHNQPLMDELLSELKDFTQDDREHWLRTAAADMRASNRNPFTGKIVDPNKFFSP